MVGLRPGEVDGLAGSRSPGECSSSSLSCAVQHAHHGCPSASCGRGADTHGRGMIVCLGDRIGWKRWRYCCWVGWVPLWCASPGETDRDMGCAVLVVVVVVWVGGGCDAADSPPGVS